MSLTLTRESDNNHMRPGIPVKIIDGKAYHVGVDLALAPDRIMVGGIEFDKDGNGFVRWNPEDWKDKCGGTIE